LRGNPVAANFYVALNRLELAPGACNGDNVVSGYFALLRRIAIPRLDVTVEEIMSPIAQLPMLPSLPAAA